ncbi:uncharacterized protein LOC129617970 [Condylostylus longicornis]|uniref:uncharacterized protein LOC129617970 n=1 Tax=Condylostylus longicornis TaxID=2530218 RepID=UPI00244DE771|nr:uncharacterized protein LOC129617970 [Condylostylus longicornis]
MSDINDADELLNCELLGELDEHALLGNEDDLLLSDEEVKEENKAAKSSTKSNEANKSNKENKKYTENNQLHKSDNVGKSNKATDGQPSDIKVTTSGLLPKENTLNPEGTTLASFEEEIKSQNDEVSSTNKDIKINEDEYLPISQESSNLDELNYEPDIRDEDSEENLGERLNIKQASEREDVSSSPEKNHQNLRYHYGKRGRGRGGGPLFLPRNHPPNIRIPFNSRQALGGEKSNPHGMQQMQYSSNSLPPYSNEHQPQIPLPRHPYHPPGGHIMNPRMDFPHHRPMGPTFIPQNLNEGVGGPRMYGQRHPQSNGMIPAYNNRPQAGNLMRPMYRPSDPNQLRPRMPLRPQPPIPIGAQNNPNYIPQPVTQIPQPHLIQSSMGGNLHQNPSNSAVLPRKVLINPNFKGGVEAATSQLMKDTQFIQTISSHVSHLQSDEELLRQQEEFIKKNQMQIDKRRYARSPGRSRSRSRSRSRGRVRSRERSYSPPKRREFYRDRRGGGFRGAGGRNRRANSRDWENDKRRRSFSPDRKDKDRNPEEEDEETRAYRLEIEKQKAMREKILKDKELRRRKAAEEKLTEDKNDEPLKLKPIVVTESKIISLKKVKDRNEMEQANNKMQRNSSTNKKGFETSSSSTSPQRAATKRSIPTAKILPDAKRSLTEHIKKDIAVSTTTGGSNTIKSTAQSTTSSIVAATTTAVIKPVFKKSTTVQTDFSKSQKTDCNSDEMLDDYDDELLEEERLLASPTPSPSNTPEIGPEIENDIDDDDDNIIYGKNDDYDTASDTKEDFVDDDENIKQKPKKLFMSSNRKVLLKPFQKNSDKIDSMKKKVFDRLEKPKPKVSVKDSAKKRIQKIIE